jgi:hypothetical protein
MKTDRDYYLFSRWHQDIKKGKDSKKWKVPRQLLIILRLLIVVARLFITIIVIIIVGRSTREAYTKSD